MSRKWFSKRAKSYLEGGVLLVVCLGVGTGQTEVVRGEEPRDEPPAKQGLGAEDPILDYLQEQVSRRPEHADSWRLLARHQRKTGQLQVARKTLARAITLAPASLAVLYERGELALLEGDPAAADKAFVELLRQGRESEYAERFRNRHPAAAARLSGVVTAERTAPLEESEEQALPASYEIQTFDGSADAEEAVRRGLREAADPLSRLRVFLELGVLYNSNVSLAPTSRDLRQPGTELGAFQLFASPDLEWELLRGASWSLGPIARGYGTINESNLSAFDLTSYQPGFFLERQTVWRETDWIGRAEYGYTLDLFDGDRIADRHGVTLSMTAIRSNGNFLYGFWSSRFSQFADDGATPETDSLDGPAHSAGVTQFLAWDRRWVERIHVGIDGEFAETEGADFRYDALNLHGGATCRLNRRWSLLPEAGVGYRSYADFTGTPSRNEVTWRVASRLRWDWSDQIALALVVRHDRFASQNEAFDAERTEGGVTLSYSR